MINSFSQDLTTSGSFSKTASSPMSVSCSGSRTSSPAHGHSEFGSSDLNSSGKFIFKDNFN